MLQILQNFFFLYIYIHFFYYLQAGTTISPFDLYISIANSTMGPPAYTGLLVMNLISVFSSEDIFNKRKVYLVHLFVLLMTHKT